MRSFNSLLISVVLIVISIPAVLASIPGEVISVKIPFDFKIGDQEYESGNYRMQLNADSPPVIIDMKSGRKRFLRGGTLKGATLNNSPHIVFDCYGDQRFLREIVGVRRGYTLRETKLEKEIREAGGAGPEKVVIQD